MCCCGVVACRSQTQTAHAWEEWPSLPRHELRMLCLGSHPQGPTLFFTCPRHALEHTRATIQEAMFELCVGPGTCILQQQLPRTLQVAHTRNCVPQSLFVNDLLLHSGMCALRGTSWGAQDLLPSCCHVSTHLVDVVWFCEGVDRVQADHAPQVGVAQGDLPWRSHQAPGWTSGRAGRGTEGRSRETGEERQTLSHKCDV